MPPCLLEALHDGREVDQAGLNAAGAARAAQEPWSSLHDQVRRLDPATGQERILAGVGGTALNGTTRDRSLSQPGCPAFTPGGDLQVLDSGGRSVKRIQAKGLGGLPVAP